MFEQRKVDDYFWQETQHVEISLQLFEGGQMGKGAGGLK